MTPLLLIPFPTYLTFSQPNDERRQRRRQKRERERKRRLPGKRRIFCEGPDGGEAEAPVAPVDHHREPEQPLLDQPGQQESRLNLGHTVHNLLLPISSKSQIRDVYRYIL